MEKPLAEVMRPQRMKDIVGQEHVIGSGKILYEIVNKKQPTSLILWGPPGSGKTTIARIIAAETDTDFIELSAVTSGKSDIVKVIEHAKQNQRLHVRTTVFIDEIHRFNKSQQDAFLPHVEDGTIILIGATTENPSFEVINPLLSRSRVVVLEPLSKQALKKIIMRAAKQLKLPRNHLPKNSVELLASISAGDARIALGTLELATKLTSGIITTDIVSSAAQKKIPRYDKNGEMHYDLISAFIKSLRGSDEAAAHYYLARILSAGEDPKFIARRMIVFASEDVGIAASAALNIAVSTFLAVERIGMPECSYTLFHCASVLAKCEKSRDVTDKMNAAQKLALDFPDASVPLHLRNAPTKLMKNLGYSEGTKWEANFKHPKGFMPEEIVE